MLLVEAIRQLKVGKCLHRTGWVPQDGYVVFMPGMEHVWKIVLTPAPNAGNYIFSVADLCAEDWELYNGPKEIVEAVPKETELSA